MINSVNQSVYSHFNSLPQYSAQNKTNKSPVWANFKINRQLTDNLNNNTTKASIFYINDVHGQNIRMERLLTAVQQFDSFTPSGQVDKMKFASGDIMLGEDIKHLMVGNKFLNLGGFMANVLGNHECDEPTPEFVNIIKDKTYRLLGLNLNPNKDNPLHGIIEKSYIQEVNGNKYGIIGLVPPDLADHVKIQDHLPALNIETDFNKAIPELQKEVDKLQAQGINKIILLSHSGYRHDVQIAKSVNGIDIILGAHTHNLLNGIEKDVNLFTSKTGEPIIITQAGRDGKNFGILNVEFDKDGVITKAQNNIGNTDAYSRNLVARNIFEKILGKPERVGFIKSVEKYPQDAYGSENAHCDFIVDALRKELGTDIAVMNSGNIRGQFEQGGIDTRDLAIISPFANKVAVVEASEAEIVNAIKNRVKASMSSKSHRPGIVQVSGLKYTFTKSGELLSMTFVDKDGKETPIDINNPRTDKMYTVASDDYCINSPEMGLGLPHRYEKAIQKFDHDKDIVVGNYIKHENKPMEVKADGRIQVIDDTSAEKTTEETKAAA